MDIPKFELGTLVQLKSGGPVMTLGEHAGGTDFYCYWFDDNNAFQKKSMSVFVLEDVSSKEDKN